MYNFEVLELKVLGCIKLSFTEKIFSKACGLTVA